MKRALKNAVPAILALGIFAAVANIAIAHHGYAVFNTSTQATVSGTVKQFVWMNPHTWLWLNVQNSQGGVDVWGFEGMSPNFLGRRGWSRTSLKPGDPITITFYPFKNPSQKGGAFLIAKRPNGEELKMFLGDDAATDK
jgi:Family of unknown function (DUF6152)